MKLGNCNTMQYNIDSSKVEHSKMDLNTEDQSIGNFCGTHHTNPQKDIDRNHISEVLSFKEFVDNFFNEDHNIKYSYKNASSSMDNGNSKVGNIKNFVRNSVDAQIKNIVSTSIVPESMFETSLCECHADNNEEENITDFNKTGILSFTLCDNIIDVQSN